MIIALVGGGGGGGNGVFVVATLHHRINQCEYKDDMMYIGLFNIDTLSITSFFSLHQYTVNFILNIIAPTPTRVTVDVIIKNMFDRC